MRRAEQAESEPVGRGGEFVRRCARALASGGPAAVAQLTDPHGEFYQELGRNGRLLIPPGLTELQELEYLAAGTGRSAAQAAVAAVAELVSAIGGGDGASAAVERAGGHWRAAQVLLPAPGPVEGGGPPALGAVGGLPDRVRPLLPSLERMADPQAAGFLLLLALVLLGRRPQRRGQVVRIPVLLDLEVGGQHAELAAWVVRDGPPGLHPDPETMGFLWVDAAFATGLAHAWGAAGGAGSGLCVLWTLTQEGVPVEEVRQGSLSAAFGVAVSELRRRLRPGRRWFGIRMLAERTAVSGVLGASGELRALAGGRSIERKVRAARAGGLAVVMPKANRTEGMAAARAEGVDVRFAADLSDAAKLVRRTDRRKLTALVAVFVLLAGAGTLIPVLLTTRESNRVLGADNAVQRELAAQASATASEQAGLAVSRHLADQSRVFRSTDPLLSMGLAIESFRAADTPQARTALGWHADQPVVGVSSNGGMGGLAFTAGRLAALNGTDGVSVQRMDTTGAGRLDVRRSDLPIRLAAPSGAPVLPGWMADSAALSSDGARLAVGRGHVVSVLEADTGRLTGAVRLPEGADAMADEVDTVRFGPDGRYLVVGRGETTFVFRDLDTAGRRTVPGTLLGVVAAAGGPAVVTVAQGRLSWWDLETGNRRKDVQVPEPATAGTRTVSADGRLYAWSGPGERVRVLDLGTGSTVLDVTPPAAQGAPASEQPSVAALAFSADATSLASGGFYAPVRIWDLASRQQRVELTGPAGWVGHVAFDADGARLAAAASDGSVWVWRTTDRPRSSDLDWSDSPVRALAYGPDGKLLAAGTAEGALVGAPEPGEAPWPVGALVGSGRGWGLGFSADGAVLATVQSGLVRWDTREHRVRSEYDRVVTEAAFTRDAKRAVGSWGTRVELLDLDAGTVLRELEGRAGDEFRSVGWSLRERAVVAASAGGRVVSWSAEDGHLLWESGLNGARPAALAVSPDGASVAVAADDGTVRILRAEDGKPVRSLRDEAGAGPLTAVAYSRDGRRLASGGQDGRVRLWEAAGGAFLETVTTHVGKTDGDGDPAPVTAVAFSADGQVLASASQEGGIRLTRAASLADPETVIKSLCALGAGLSSAQRQTYLTGAQQSRPTCY
ncbi:WD40 repeat domain-containing protein [Kitasatospora sp. NPDC004289]